MIRILMEISEMSGYRFCAEVETILSDGKRKTTRLEEKAAAQIIELLASSLNDTKEQPT